MTRSPYACRRSVLSFDVARSQEGREGAGRASAALDGQVCKLMDGRQPRADRLARDGRADDADDRGMRLRPDEPDVEVGAPRVARIPATRAAFCRSAERRVGYEWVRACRSRG